MRRPRESSAVGHATPPIIVREQEPVDDHPGLGPMTRRKIRKIAGRSGGKHHKVKVEVKVTAGGAPDGEA